MSWKDKMSRLKTLALGTILASTTLSSCDLGKNRDKEPIQDMMALKEIEGADIYGNPLRLVKVDVPIYASEEMIDEKYTQMLWGLKPNKSAANREGEKTHAEEYQPTGSNDTFFVEVYDADGVLAANNSLILVNGQIAVLGEGEQYRKNLQRRRGEIKEEREAKQAEARKRARLQERADARKAALRAAAEQKAQAEDSVLTQTLPIDSVVSLDSAKHQLSSSNAKVAHKIDSIAVADTLKHLKNQHTNN